MDQVYLAHDPRLQRDVAIKVLPPSILTDDRARSRFRKDALALAKLNHPGIASIFDVGEEFGTAYIVMECVGGESLTERLKRGPLITAQTLDFGAQIAKALTEAHETCVIHRDLKLANVMITPKGQVKVLGFGLSKLLEQSDGEDLSRLRTETGAAAGTPLYMSPEQVFGEAVDSGTDLWSLGVALYESLAGRRPFTGATDYALMLALSEQTPPSIGSIRADVPVPVAALVSKAMSRDLATRYQTASALDADATAILAALCAPSQPKFAQRRKITPRVAIPSAIGVVALAALAT